MKDKIFRFARSIVSDCEEAEDVTQDIFEKLWVRKEALEECANLEGFVMNSVRNLCYDRLRSRRMRDEKVKRICDEALSVVPEVKTDAADAAAIAEMLIAKLPEKHRMVIHLRDVEGCEIETICQVMGMDPPAVRMTLSRARKRVREGLIKIMEYGLR